jgi:hypothetical protein
MSTQKQINANRKNAQKSTGPKTDEGKATVSQNAIKHGLFAQSIVFGENEADFEAFHDNMLAELAPVGVVESVLAERAVNLAWRLRRAERMQNEVIEDMIGRKVTTNPARRARENYYYNQGRRPDELGVDLDELPLGRIATNDFAYCRVLDRMLMYERRIENSMIKSMRELERRQVIRQFHQQESEQELSIKLAPSTAGGLKHDLKKQSQFTLNLMGATPFVKRFYGVELSADNDKNKANQSQLCAPVKVEGTSKREISPASATG